MKIDPNELEQIARQGIETKKDVYGNTIAWKGPWLAHWYDNYMEMLKENQWQRERDVLKSKGLNDQAQTPEQEAAFKKRQKVQLARKEKAELAGEMAAQNK